MSTNNSLEQGLLISMQDAGYSIDEVSMLDLSPDEAKRKIAGIMRQLYFDYKDREIVEKNLQMKNNFLRYIYGVENCPFKQVTGISWEDMFHKAHMPTEENYLFKVIHPFFHIAVSSADYKKDILYKSKDNTFPTFEMLFYHSGREMVQIGNHKYTYGEALMRMRRFEHIGMSPLLAISQSVFIIDEKLIPELLIQPEYNSVFRLLYTLYHLSSHDGMLHGLFKDSSRKIQDLLSEDPIGSRFLGTFDRKCLIYEVNYLRLMRHLFDVCCKKNDALKTDVYSLYLQVCEITKAWPTVLGQYIRFIAFDRVSRLISIKSEILFPKFIGLIEVATGIERIFDDHGMRIKFLIHHNASEKEAVLFDGGPSVSYRSMVRAMFEVY